jgi:hypothetical protein
MVEMEQVPIVRQEWVIKHSNIIIPIKAIKAFTEIIMLFVVAVFAYNVGQNDAAEQIKLNSYLTNTGFYNSDTQRYEKCELLSAGSRLMWNCPFYTPNASYNRFLVPVKDLNFTKLNNTIK